MQDPLHQRVEGQDVLGRHGEAFRVEDVFEALDVARRVVPAGAAHDAVRAGAPAPFGAGPQQVAARQNLLPQGLG